MLVIKVNAKTTATVILPDGRSGTVQVLRGSKGSYSLGLEFPRDCQIIRDSQSLRGEDYEVCLAGTVWGATR